MRPLRHPWQFWLRLVGFAGLALLVLFLLRPDAPFPPPTPLAPRLLPVPADPGILDLQLTQNIRLRLQPSPEPPLPPPPAPVSPPPPPSPLPAAPETTETSREDSTEGVLTAAIPRPQTAAESEPAAASQPAELALRPRYYVVPHVPERTVRKRKIDATVLLQCYVGSDGRVREVRVLRSIPDCEECNQSAVAAARGFVYDVPIDSGAVWTTPFELHFTDRR